MSLSGRFGERSRQVRRSPMPGGQDRFANIIDEPAKEPSVLTLRHDSRDGSVRDLRMTSLPPFPSRSFPAAIARLT